MIEALKNAQTMHDKVGKAVNGPEFRDGYEALDMTEAKLQELGVEGMLSPFKISCAKHDGAQRWRMMQWDGAKFQMVSDWLDRCRGGDRFLTPQPPDWGQGVGGRWTPP